MVNVAYASILNKTRVDQSPLLCRKTIIRESYDFRINQFFGKARIKTRVANGIPLAPVDSHTFRTFICKLLGISFRVFFIGEMLHQSASTTTCPAVDIQNDAVRLATVCV